MGKLVGLEGCSRDIDALFVNNGEDIRVILNNDYAATAAGDNGAINVYKDDLGYIRAVSMKHYQDIEKKKFLKMAPAIRWTEKWLLKIGVRPK